MELSVNLVCVPLVFFIHLGSAIFDHSAFIGGGAGTGKVFFRVAEGLDIAKPRGVGARGVQKEVRPNLFLKLLIFVSRKNLRVDFSEE